jgi:hypothetical protein
MVFSLNCLILRQDTCDIFNISVGEIYKINGVNIEFKDLIVAIKIDLFSRKEQPRWISGKLNSNAKKAKIFLPKMILKNMSRARK